MELRLYSFCNFYLSSIQQGIQTGHAAVDLVRLYTHAGNFHQLASNDEVAATAMVTDWADNWKTFIILNGGDHAGVQAAGQTCFESGLPHIHFTEPGLGDIKTCWVVVVPENVFNARLDSTWSSGVGESIDLYVSKTTDADGVETRHMFGPDHKHYKLIQLLRSCGLAK